MVEKEYEVKAENEINILTNLHDLSFSTTARDREIQRETERELWSTLGHTDRQKEISIPRAPVGAKDLLIRQPEEGLLRRDE